MWISDERLSAYVDGEVSAEEARIIEDTAAADIRLARHLERLRELSRVFGETCAQLDRVPLPEDVLARLAPAEDGEAASGGTLLRFRKREERRAPRRPAAALAASIALIAGIGLGAFFTRAALQVPEPGEHQFAAVPAASGPVFDVLETRRSGQAVPIGGTGQDAISVLPVLTFESGSGTYCREYVVSHDETAMRGLACRDEGTWNVLALVAQELPGGGASTGQFIPAEGPSPAGFDEVVDSLDPREPLSARAEQEAIEKGWQP